MTKKELHKLVTESIHSLVEKKLCPKGRAYYNRRIAAGEVPSAYLSGRAVKVCKGLMEEDDIPQSGESSGAPAKFKPGTKPEKIESLTLDQIFQQVKGIPYYKEVLDDLKKGDESWIVTKKVKEYADYMMKNPSSLSKLPPIIVVDGKIQDGAHRISAIYLLQNLLDSKNSFWKNLKLKVEFWNSSSLNINEEINPLTWEPIIKDEAEEIERTAEDLNLPYDTIYNAFVNGREVTLNDDMWSRLENTDSYDIDSEEEAIELARQYGKDYQSILAAEKTPPALILQYSPNKFYLVGGNTRLMFARAKGINPQVILATIEPKAKWAYQDVTGEIDESLRDWFKKEDWVRIDTQGNITGDCGTMKKGKATTRCLPRAKANRLTKAERAATARKKAAADRKGDRVVSNTDKAKVKFRK